MKQFPMTNFKHWLSKLFVLTCCLLMLGINASAQYANTYTATLELEGIEWTYDCADIDLLSPTLGGGGACAGISIDLGPLGTFAITFGEAVGDFYINVDGNSYFFSEDNGFDNDDSYQADDIVSAVSVAFAGDAVGSESNMWVDFTIAENDCDDATIFNTDNSVIFGGCPGFDAADLAGALGLPIPGGLFVVPDPDDLYFYDANLVDWVAVAGTSVVGGFTYVNEGEFPVTMDYVGTDDDGAPFSASLTFTLRVTAAPPTCPANAVDVTFPDGNGYTCLDEFTATTSVTIAGGTPPYTIIGSGIYAAGGINYGGSANGTLPAGAFFDFGATPFGLTQDAAGAFTFQVNEDQPWMVIVTDFNGCVAAAEGLYDQPDPEIASDFSSICLNGPIFDIYDEAIFSDPTAVAGDWFVDLDVSQAGANQITLADSQVFTVDPNDFGPGQHKISYCIEDNYDCDLYICDDLVINVFPAFYPDEIGFILEPQYTTCQVPLGGTPGVPLNLGGDDNNNAADGDYLTNAEVNAVFAGVEDAFDPDGDIDEADYFVVWQGPGVHDIGAAGNYFDPAEAGVGTHSICVTVGYPDCNQTYCRSVEVVADFDPAVALNPLFYVCENAQGHADLLGGSEVPANNSSGIGDVYFTFDDSNNGLTLNITYSGLSGAPTAAHVHNGAAGSNGPVVTAITLTPPTSPQGTFTGSATLSNADAAAFLSGNLYVNIHTAAFPNGELRGQLDDFTGSLACSSDEGCPLTVNADAAAELLNFNSGATGHSGNVAPSGTTTATATIAIPQADQVTIYAIITNLTLQYNYLAATNDPAADGDYDQITIVGPGGVTIYTESNPGGSGANDHFGFRTITFEEIVAAYDASTPGVADDGLAVLTNALRCSNPAFSYTLVSNSDNYQINIDADLSYTNQYGEFYAIINAPGGNVLPDEAITFDVATGLYTFNSRFTTEAGEYYDLGAYDEIQVCFVNVGNCSTLSGADGSAQCASEHCMVVQVVSGGNADINNEPLCLSSFDALHLPTAFFIDGVTTPGGVWTIADANSPDGASNTAGTGVYGEFFNPWMVPAGTYNVCYSLFEAESNPLIDCGAPIQGADCATIIVPVHYCVEFAENVVCENCDEDGLLPIIIGTVDPATGNCIPLEEDINIGGDVYETFTACRSEYDNNNSDADGDVATGTTDVQNQRPTTLDAWDAYGQSNTNAAWQICNDNPATIEKQEGLYTVIENTFTLPAGAQIDDITFRYNYVSMTGTAQGDHDGWGVYFNSFPACVGNSTYPTNVLTDAAGDPIGYADNQDPDGDNHFPAAFPSTAFEVRDAASAHITAVQNAINTLPANECAIEFTYYYVVASNSQYWDACFNVDVAYHFNEGEEPQTTITAVFHEPLEDGNIEPLYPQWTPTNPIVALDEDNNNVEEYYLNTCNLGGFDEISLIVDIEAALDDDCDGIQVGSCFPVVYSDALVVLESDGFTCDFTTNVSPSVCQGETITITPAGMEGTWEFVDTYTWAITDADPATAGIQFVIPSTAPDGTAVTGGLYQIIHTATSQNGCVCISTENVLVIEPSVATTTGGASTFTVCASSLPVDLTQFIGGSSSTGGTFTASAGDVVAGQILMTVSGGSADITYNVNDNASGCDASVTFTVTTVSEAIADFDIIDQMCVGTTVDLTDYLTSVSTLGGNFSIGGVVIANPTSYTFENVGLVEIVYSVGVGECADADAQNIYVLDQESAQAEYGFICQSDTDEDGVDLTQFLPDGSGVNNGGTFNMLGLPLFISEIEYTGGAQIPASNTADPSDNLAHDWVEVTGPAGTDLSNYALVFYVRGDYTDDGTWNDPLSSGHVYGWMNLSGVIDNEVTASSGVSYGAVAFPYYDLQDNSAINHDVDCRGNNIVEAASISGIAAGPAAIALVWVGDQDCDELDNNDVVQYIGYGTRPDNTNAGIFSACDGPASTLVTTDINVIDVDVPAAGFDYDKDLFGGDLGVDLGKDYSLQFTNGCWVVPGLNDSEVAYATNGPGIADDDDDLAPNTNADLSTAGQLNLGLVGDTFAEGNDYGHGGADELYFDYVAPNGDIIDLDKLCHVLFVGGQIVNTAPWVNQENEAAGGGFEDDDVVTFECQTQTYTIPFGYQVLGNGQTTCSSEEAVFFLTVLMDYEENWNGSAPGSADPEIHEAGDHGYEVLKEGVCDYSETNLNQYIDDIVHFIPPTHFEGSFDTTATFTFEENVKNPEVSELHYSHYGYTGTAADDHCVVYNFIDDNNTPFNNDDDTFKNWNFCEGIEISAEVGTELSCYGLVFYTNSSPNGRGLGADVTYIGVDGMPHTTDVANGSYMQLYGRVDEDPVDWSLPNGSVLSVPIDNGEADAWGHLPWYGGFNPITGSNGNGPTAADDGSVDNPVRHQGLYIDVNSNERYDAADVPVPSAVNGVPSDAANFPWERGNECPKPDAGSRWFPILDIPGGPGEIAGVGLVNQCNGELIKYISWGGQICNEDKEGFTLAGPFEQLTSEPIDTIQNVNGTLGDQRTLQLVSCSQLPACPAGEDQVWILSYNGGSFTIPGTGGAEVIDSEELYEFSNSIGYYNCNMAVEDVVAQPEAFTLDLMDASFPDNFVITDHVVEVTIGSVDNNYSQLYTYHIGMGACQIPDNGTDLAEYTNTNNPNIVPGQYCGGDFDGDITNINPAMDLDINPTDGIYDFLTHPFSPFDTNDMWAAGNVPSPVYQGSTVDGYGYPAENGSNDTDSHCLGCTSDPNYCHDDLEFGPDQNDGGNGTWVWTTTTTPRVNQAHLGINNQAYLNGQLEFAFDNGNGELNPDGACMEGYCTMLAKTTYTVDDLRALLYNGNLMPGYEDGIGDTCRQITPDLDEVRVTIRVRLTYEQCMPVGHFAGTDVSLNEDEIEMPYWAFEPEGLADISPIAITYDVTNAHEIETDDANDDLACLDDDNDNIRTQFIDVLGAGSASLSASAVSVCSADLPLNLNNYVSGGSGTWSGAGVSGTMYNGAGGTVTFTVGSGTCQDQATLTITVDQSASVNVSGLPSTVCAGTTVSLPAATWTGDGVSGNSWTAPNAGGDVTLSYSAGSAACGVSGTVTINVDTPLSVSESFDAAACAVTLTISGGNGAGSYMVGGMAIAGSTTTLSVTSGASYTVQVSSNGSACGSLDFTGGPHACTPSCIPNAFNLQVTSGTNFCGNSNITATAGFGDNNLGTYILTDANGNVVATSPNGVFDNLVNAVGIYNVWAGGYCSGTTLGNNVAALTDLVNAGLLDLEGPIAVTISPAIEVVLTAVCVPGQGWAVQSVVSGGDVAVEGQGAYSSNVAITQILDGEVIPGSGIVTSPATFLHGGPFNPGSTVVFSFGDGSLCNTSASITIPSDACGIAAAGDNANTLTDQPIIIDVLSNDVGSDIEITGYTQPENGTVTLDANGNFVYTPNEGFAGTDVFNYEITGSGGQEVATQVIVVVAGSGALTATDIRDCSDAAITGFSVVSINVSGGTAPYVVEGSYSTTMPAAGSVSFDLAEGSGYYIEVTDATGAVTVIDESNALPCTKVSVELLSFDGEVKSEGNFLKWATASEINNDFFTLEYSTNGVDFERITTVDGNGTTSASHTYSFLHTSAKEGIGYYRLSTTDFDGKVVVEGVITLVRGELGFSFVSIRPVPATTVLNVEFNNTLNSNVRVEVYNAIGQMVSAQNVATTSGINNAQVDVSNFANGTYFLTINNGAEVRVTKFVKN